MVKERGKIILNNNLLCDLLLRRITDIDSHKRVTLQSCKTENTLKICIPSYQLRPHRVSNWFDLPTSLTSTFPLPSSSPATTLYRVIQMFMECEERSGWFHQGYARLP